jgi:hypothetical protein
VTIVWLHWPRQGWEAWVCCALAVAAKATYLVGIHWIINGRRCSEQLVYPDAPPLPPRVQVIVYATSMGAIGAFYPFTSREDADFFTHLEMHMRQVGGRRVSDYCLECTKLPVARPACCSQFMGRLACEILL